MRQIRKQPGKSIHWGCWEQEPLLRSGYFLFGKKRKKRRGVGGGVFQFSSAFLQSYPEFPMGKLYRKIPSAFPFAQSLLPLMVKGAVGKTGFSSCSWTFPSIPHLFNSIPDPVPSGPAHLRGCQAVGRGDGQFCIPQR